MTTPNRHYSTVRVSWTGDLAKGWFRGVLKEVGTDAWLWECPHAHPTKKLALDCAKSQKAEQLRRSPAYAG